MNDLHLSIFFCFTCNVWWFTFGLSKTRTKCVNIVSSTLIYLKILLLVVKNENWCQTLWCVQLLTLPKVLTGLYELNNISGTNIGVFQGGSGGRSPWSLGKLSFRANQMYFQGKKTLRIAQNPFRQCKNHEIWGPTAASRVQTQASSLHFQGKF